MTEEQLRGVRARRSWVVSAPVKNARIDLFLSAVFLLSLQSLPAQEIEIQTFTMPQFEEWVRPDYPISEIMLGGEAMVALTFMVGTDGRAIDPVVIESVGASGFEDEAIDALLDSRFEPARQAGEPIMGSMTTRYWFALPPEFRSNASPEFVGAYRRFERDIADGDAKRIEGSLAALERIGAENLYEYAYLGLARYHNAVRIGSELEQLAHLRQVLPLADSPEDRLYLTGNIVTELRRAQLTLELRNRFYAEAIDTFGLMEESADTEGVAIFKAIIDELEAVRFDDSEYTIPLDLDDQGNVGLRLFKRHFALLDGEGRLDEVELRCEKQFVAFAVERDVSYDVPTEWGECHIQIIGDARGSVDLLQH